MTASYYVAIDNFRVFKNGTLILQDPFSDGDEPPSGPEFTSTPAFPIPDYVTVGGFSESGGRAILDSAVSANSGGAGPNSPIFSLNSTLLQTNIDPTNTTLGLKSNSSFRVDGLFDLAIPDDPLEAYGVRLSDRSATQDGDDVIELVVRRGTDGIVRVQLRELDFVNHEGTTLGSVILDAGSNDQIRLNLFHTAGEGTTGIITASFDLLTAGSVTDTINLSATASIFGTETPGFAGDDENWTRPGFVAYAPDPDFPGANTIEGDENDNLLAGTNLVDEMFGFGGNDKLIGKENDDLLYGGDGNDVLFGGGGVDQMFGGAGDDRYVVKNAGDQVVEVVNDVDQGGFDFVRSFVDFTLGEGVEGLLLVGAAAEGVGNDLANKLVGNDGANTLSGGGGNDKVFGNEGNDILIGGEGNDVLIGGADADVFVFDAPTGTSVDRVIDFSSAEGDKIAVYGADYGLAAGTLDPGSFDLFGTLGSGQARFIFNDANNVLVWDGDGLGSTPAVAIARFVSDVTLQASDFIIY